MPNDTPVRFTDIDLSGYTMANVKSFFYVEGNNTEVNTSGGDSVAKTSQGLAVYESTVTEALEGIHRVELQETVSSLLIASGWIVIEDTTTAQQVHPTMAAALAASYQAAIPTVVDIEAALLNEGDGQQLIDAIIQSINTSLDVPNLELTVIANAVRDAILDRVLSGNHDTAGSAGNALQNIASAGDITTSQAEILSKLLAYVQLLARKDTAIATDNAAELAEVNADGGSGAGTYDNASHSQEAVAEGVEATNRKLVTTTVRVVDHQQPDGAIVLAKGADYKVATTKPLKFPNESGSGWPTNLDGDVYFKAVHQSKKDEDFATLDDKWKIEVTGTVITPTSPDQEVWFDLDKTDTDKELGLYEYQVTHVDSSGNVSPLVTTYKPGGTAPQFTVVDEYEDKLEIIRNVG